MKSAYNYAIIKENNKYMAMESTFLPCKYEPKKKFVLIEKQCFKDGSEGINRIVFSNDIEDLSQKAKQYISYYNYVSGHKKDIQGNVSEIN